MEELSLPHTQEWFKQDTLKGQVEAVVPCRGI